MFVSPPPPLPSRQQGDEFDLLGGIGGGAPSQPVADTGAAGSGLDSLLSLDPLGDIGGGAPAAGGVAAADSGLAAGGSASLLDDLAMLGELLLQKQTS